MGVSVDLFSTLVNICMVAALTIGGARLLWLFVSPIPKSLETVRRPRFLTIGRFAPLLILLGCGGVVGFVAIVLWLKAAPHGWSNIFPFLAAYVLGFVGATAMLGGITVQSILVDANRGFALEADTGNLQRNVDAAFLFAFGVVALATMGFHWLPSLDWSTATLAEIEHREAIIRVPIYLAAFAAIIRTYYAVRGRTPTTSKGLALLATWATTVLFIVFNAIIKSILPRDYEIERYLRNRDNPVSLLGVEVPLALPPDISHGEILAVIGLCLIATMCVTTLVDMFARRGVTSVYVPQRFWPGLLFACLSAASTALFSKHAWPQNVVFDWIGEVAAPLAIGMVLMCAFPAMWEIGARGARYAAKAAARGLLAQILLFLSLAPLVVTLLYAASLLTTVGFATILLGGMAAAALGWLRLPIAAPSAEVAPATPRLS